jgi:hypothetical protein
MSETDIPPTSALMPLLQFTAEDLAANQQGRLSPVQQARLQAWQRRLVFMGSVAFISISFLATLFIFGGQTSANPLLSFCGVMLTVLNAITLGLLARQWLRLSADVRGGTVEILSGQLERVLRPTRNQQNYVLRIAQVEFAVNKETFKAFRHEVAYQFYRTPHAQILLSAVVGASPRVSE